MNSVRIVYTKNAEDHAEFLARELLISSEQCAIQKFSSDEVKVSVRHVASCMIVVASTLTNDDWIILFSLLDACRDARDIILCCPYLGYTRHDICKENVSCGYQMFLRLLETFCITKLILLDCHSEPLSHISVEHLHMTEMFANHICHNFDDYLIVSPDLGGIKRAQLLSSILCQPLIICNKQRSVLGRVERVDILGSVKGKICIIIDDMIDSGDTLYKTANALIDAGSTKVYAYATHAILSEGSVAKLEHSNIDTIVVSNSINKQLSEKFSILQIDSLLLQRIRCML